MNKKIEKHKGEIALVLWMFFGSFMSVIVRFLAEYFLPFQQIFIRTFFAVIFSVIFFSIFIGKFHFSHITKQDWLYLLLRGGIVFIAIVLFVLAITYTTIANVGFIGALPTTAILGVLFLKEKLTLQEGCYLGLSILGIVLITVKDIGKFSVGIGEAYALVATFLFSAGFLVRKKISDSVGDKEISVIGTTVISLLSLITLIFFEGGIEKFIQNLHIISLSYAIGAGALFVFISYLVIYGYKRVSAIKGTSIEYLEAVFAVILGFIFFLEIPSFIDIIGGMCIVIGAYLMVKK